MRMVRPRTAGAAVASLVLLLGPPLAHAAPKAVDLTLEELWRAGGEDEEVFFGVPSGVRMDAQGNTYVLDRQLNEVMVYGPDGEYLRSIGREGEGPGEFRGAGSLFLLADGTVAVVQFMPGKIVLLSPDGTPVGDLPLPADPDGGMRFLSQADRAGETVAMSLSYSTRDAGSVTMTTTIVLVDRAGNEVARLLEASNTRDFANPVFDEKATHRATWAAGPDGRVYVVDEPFGPYRIKVFGPDGTLVRTLERKYEHRMRSAEEKKDAMGRIIIRGLPDPKIVTADHDPDIRSLYPRPDGSLWVLTSRGAMERPDGAIGTFDVFDAAGNFTHTVTLRGEGDPADDSFHMSGDRLYVVRRYRGAMDAMFAQGHEGEETEEQEEALPVEVIAYRLPDLR